MPSPTDPAAAVPREIEAGSDDERDLRYVWLSRLMFGNLGVVDPAIYRETRSYEDWLAAQGLVLA